MSIAKFAIIDIEPFSGFRFVVLNHHGFHPRLFKFKPIRA